MFRADVAMRQALSFLGGISEDALALVAERKIDRGRDFFADGGVSLDLLADGLDRGVGPQETIRQGFVFAQESEKQMLSLDVRRPELAGFIACEKDYAPGFLRIAFEHSALPLTFPVEKHLPCPTYRTLDPNLITLCNQRAVKPKDRIQL